MRARLMTPMMLLLVILSAFAQAQVVLTDDANTSSFFPTTNFGTSVALIVCSGSNTYIKFSTANLGSGVTSSNVSKATLTLYVDAVLTSGTMDVYQVNGSWSEGKITYNSAPALGTKLFSAVSVSSTGYLSLDMTSTVQAWLNGTLANNGIALVPSSGSKISVSFDSKENIFTSHTAQLNLVLVSAGPQGPQGPQGVQGPQGLAGAAGPQGAAGPAGPAGATGLTGPAGQQGPQGLVGLTGATGAAGPAGPAGANGTGFNFRNAFDNSASYAVNDVVTFQGASYVATTANQGPNNPTPDQNSSAWSVMAAQGAAGAAGAQGPSGSAGPIGPPGPVGPVGPQGPVGPMPTGAALTNAANTFTTSQTIGGSLVLTGAGSGVQFADGTVQNSAATGGTSSGSVIVGNSPAPPAGYTLAAVISTGNAWLPVAPMQAARYAPAAASVNGLMYAIGGAIGGTNGLVFLNSVEVYNAANWTTVASMPTARDYLAAVAVSGLIYAIGGGSSSPDFLNTVEVYNPANNSWTTAAPMPTARDGLAAAAVNGLIYAIGGLSGSGSLNTVEVYNPASNSWTTAAPMPTARWGVAAAAVNGLIYAIGGFGSGSSYLNTVEVYNPATNSWSTAAAMPTARAELAADALNGLVYAIGGSNGSSYLNTVEVYNPATNSWSTAGAIPTAAIGLAAADVNGLVYAIGGVSPGNIYSNAVAQYSQPVTLYLFIKS
jgi:N-acetylneuraminic acid mutarotase